MLNIPKEDYIYITDILFDADIWYEEYEEDGIKYVEIDFKEFKKGKKRFKEEGIDFLEKLCHKRKYERIIFKFF